MRYLFLFSLLLPSLLFGGYSHISGKWSPEEYAPQFSVQEHYDLGYQELYNNNWGKALIHFMVIIYHYDDSPFYNDSIFYSGICYYFKADFDLANRQFDRYLALSGKLKHFEKVFEFKYQIANHFSQGNKKHVFGKQKLPKWLPAKKDALSLYDEIIAALPGKDIAAEALFSKAQLLFRKKEHRESIEALQTVYRRFPKHPLAAESYLLISKIYLSQSRVEAQNPDLIALAQINLQRFLKSFPSDERIDEAEANLLSMKEVYAQSLYDTGRFYERKKKPYASAIYYQDTIQKYPETEAANKSRDRLAHLNIENERTIAVK